MKQSSKQPAGKGKPRAAAAERYVLSLLVVDRVGILRDITSVVADLNGSIDGISQTVMGGFFTVILTAAFPAGCGEQAVREAMMARFSDGEASLLIRAHPQPATRPAAPAGARYIVTAVGRDRSGILKAVTEHLAGKGINIEDWYVQFNGETVTHIGEVTVPTRLDIKQVQDEFRDVLARFGLSCGMQHQNIFRATNEIGPIAGLLAEGFHA